MLDFVDGTAFNYEQGQRARKLFAAVVLAALDDAIELFEIDFALMTGELALMLADLVAALGGEKER